jgi:hypothetical protein
MFMEVLYHLVRMSALPVGVHHDDTTLPDKALQSVFDLDCGKCRVGIAGHNIPQNELEAESASDVDGVVVELPIGRTKQRRVMIVFGFE